MSRVFPALDFVMLRRVLLAALALLSPPLDARLGQQLVPLQEMLLRSCDKAKPQAPAALRNATPSSFMVLIGVPAGNADCGAVRPSGQPDILQGLSAASIRHHGLTFKQCSPSWANSVLPEVFTRVNSGPQQLFKRALTAGSSSCSNAR